MVSNQFESSFESSGYGTGVDSDSSTHSLNSLSFNWKDVENALQLDSTGSKKEYPSSIKAIANDMPPRAAGATLHEPQDLSISGPPPASLDRQVKNMNFQENSEKSAGSMEIVDAERGTLDTNSINTINGDFFEVARRLGQLPAEAEPEFLPPKIDMQNADGRRLNAALARIIGNLAKSQEQGKESGEDLVENNSFSPSSDSGQASALDSKRAIGLELAPDEIVREARNIARAIDGLTRDSQQFFEEDLVESCNSDFDAVELPAVVEKLEIPHAAPFEYVSGIHAELKSRFETADCQYSRTLRPDGITVETQTALDYSSLTRLAKENGASEMIVHDKYRRPQFEQSIQADGTWSFSRLRYEDLPGRVRPFPAEKLTIFSDGSMTRFEFSAMGQVSLSENFE